MPNDNCEQTGSVTLDHYTFTISADSPSEPGEAAYIVQAECGGRAPDGYMEDMAGDLVILWNDPEPARPKRRP